MKDVVRILLFVTLLATAACDNHFDKNINVPKRHSEFEVQQPRRVETRGISERIDALYEGFNAIGQPGCAVGVMGVSDRSATKSAIAG